MPPYSSHLRRVFHLLDLRCEEVAALASDGLERPLPRAEQIAVTLHLGICSGCRRYRRQLTLIRHAMSRLRPESSPPIADELPGLPAGVRTRIKDALHSENS